MKLALLGYGKMGREIEKIALERKHEISLIIDINNLHELTVKNLKEADAALDFSVPQTAYSNIMTCFDANIPVVSGTTGWLDNFDSVVEYCKKNKKSFFYASNFSIGVNICFEINRNLAQLMNKFTEYDVQIEETHHIHKLDAPSGTALTFAADIIKNLDRKQRWQLNKADSRDMLRIDAIREDEVTGIHIVRYDSPVDFVEIKHEAKSRKGLALGAVLAAEFLYRKIGFYTMNDLMHAE
jgi:4-hydroxy-tetrahydrodipicolinate reductase